ncbi:MAG TPA: hypothetical protein VE999_12215 [Gemmataceae bacterium]|nr:hypothetical protein [Gemmataceae bacterium]
MRAADRGALTGFFGKFAEDPSDFVVFALIGTDLARFLPPLGFEIRRLDKIENSPQSALRPHSRIGLEHVVNTEEKAYDAYGAVSSFQQQLTSIRALTYLQPEPLICRWNEWMYVMRKDGSEGRVLRTPVLSFERPSQTTVTGRRLKNHRNYFARVFEDFRPRSTERLLSSINTAALARTSPNRENQLISMWSAIEVLLSDPPTGTARIVSYARQLIPCICLRHVRRQFVAVFEALLVSYKRQFIDILKHEPEFSKTDAHTSLAAVLCLEENKALQKDLCNLCKDNPLALQRLFKLHRDYHSLAAAARTIEGHRSRVEWQIYRIYRARNQLVHAGSVPSYLDSLILNLAEYYRASIATIINRARRDPEGSDIDQVVSEIAIEYGIFTRHFPKSSTRGLDRTELYRLVSVV